MLNNLKARGVKDILICCVDGLAGFSEAIGAVYPKTDVQGKTYHRRSCPDRSQVCIQASHGKVESMDNLAKTA